MARKYAQIITAIWRNDDFIGLPNDEQWMYLLLNTQPDISAAGVLTIAITRWAGRAPNVTSTVVRRLLEKLAEKRFVVIDWDTDELLIRSFIRWDHGYSNPKRQPAIRDAVDAVESKVILAVLSGELDRVDMPEKYRGRASIAASNVAPVTSPAASTVAAVTSTDAAGFQHQNPEFSQVDSLSMGYPDDIDRLSHSDAAEERRVPQPPNHNPLTTTPKSKPTINAPRRSSVGVPVLPGTDLAVAAVDALHTASVTKASRDRHFDEFWAAYPRRVGKLKARQVWDTKVKHGADPAKITAGAVAFTANQAAWQTPDDKIPHPTTWLNAGRWDDELAPPPAASAVALRGTNGNRPSTTDARVQAGIDLAAKYDQGA